MNLFHTETDSEKKLREDKEYLARRSADIYKGESILSAKEDVFNERSSSNRKIAELQVATEKANSSYELSVEKMTSSVAVQARDNELESEKQRAVLLEKNADLVKANVFAEANLYLLF